MKLILTSIGTRGDIEPFLAIGEMLRDKGHDVLCLFPEQFRHLAEDSGLKFESLGTKFLDLIDSPAGRIAMGGGRFGWKKIKAYKTLISKQSSVNSEMMRLQYEVIEREQPDKIVHHSKAVYPVIWGLGKENKTILISSIPYLHYVKDHAHIMVNRNLGPFWNKITYKLGNYALLKSIMGSLKYLNQTKDIKQQQIQKALFNSKAIYAVSPSLFPRPDYWDMKLKVLGFHERMKTNNWRPDAELEIFLAKHEKPILVTFGSMLNEDPPSKTKIMLDVLKKNNIAAIINTAAGGLVKPENFDHDLFYFVKHIPYDWVLPKMYAVIQHGGSGTIHSAIKYGCPSLVIPHIVDQYVWNKLVHRKGLGPLGLSVSKINPRNLEPKILDLMENKSYKQNAIAFGSQMQNENFVEEICEAITS